MARLQKSPDAGVRSWRFTLWSQSLNISEQRKNTKKAGSQRLSSPCSIRSLGAGYRSAVTSPAAGPVTSSSQSPPAAPPPDPGSGSQSTPTPSIPLGRARLTEPAETQATPRAPDAVATGPRPETPAGSPPDRILEPHVRVLRPKWQTPPQCRAQWPPASGQQKSDRCTDPRASPHPLQLSLAGVSEETPGSESWGQVVCHRSVVPADPACAGAGSPWFDFCTIGWGRFCARRGAGHPGHRPGQAR